MFCDSRVDFVVGAGVLVRYGSSDRFSLSDVHMTHNGSAHTVVNASKKTRRIRARIFHFREADRDADELQLTPSIPPDEVR